jgi:hypothetical protein
VAVHGRRAHNSLGDAEEIVKKAWRALPPPHRQLLESIGASQSKIVCEPLGTAVDDLRRSADLSSLHPSTRGRLDRALAVWVKDLRLLLINGSHPKLAGLSRTSREQVIARLAWHEWGHALSVERCSSDDIAAGSRLLALAPAGVREVIRTAGYRAKDYTHEVIAETYALLMARRLREGSEQPPWLDDEIYSMLTRVTEWSG